VSSQNCLFESENSEQLAANQQPGGMATDLLIQNKDRTKTRKDSQPRLPLAFQGKKLRITYEANAAFRLAFPSIDLAREYAKMDAWLVDNPSKPRKNLRSFARNWLGRIEAAPVPAPKREIRFGTSPLSDNGRREMEAWDGS
jgi:hypothetical protein